MQKKLTRKQNKDAKLGVMVEGNGKKGARPPRNQKERKKGRRRRPRANQRKRQEKSCSHYEKKPALRKSAKRGKIDALRDSISQGAAPKTEDKSGENLPEEGFGKERRPSQKGAFARGEGKAQADPGSWDATGYWTGGSGGTGKSQRFWKREKKLAGLIGQKKNEGLGSQKGERTTDC